VTVLRRRPRRHAVFGVSKLIASGGLLAVVLLRSHLGTVALTIAHASPRWLMAGLFITAISTLVTATNWWRLLRSAGVRRSWARCQQLELAGDVFDAALPTNVGGDFVRATYAAEQSTERTGAAAAVVVRRLCNFPGMLFVMLVGVLGTWHLSYARGVRPLALAALAGGVLGAAIFASPLLGRLSTRRGVVGRRILGPAVGFLASVHQLRADRATLGLAVVQGTLFFCLVTAATWCYMRAVGIHPPVLYAATVVTTVNVLSLLPISVGGAGVREGGYAALLGVGSLASAAQGTAVGLCVTSQTLLFGLFGLPFYLVVRHTRRQAQRHHPHMIKITEAEGKEPAARCVS
jgi:glycosyltransferase 2 family protein